MDKDKHSQTDGTKEAGSPQDSPSVLQKQSPELQQDATKLSQNENQARTSLDKNLRRGDPSAVSRVLGAKGETSKFELVDPGAGALRSVEPTAILNAPDSVDKPGPAPAQDRLPPITHKDGTVVQRYYGTEDVKQAADGTLDQAGEAIKALKHPDGTPATAEEKAQYAIDIMGARIRTLGYLHGDLDNRGKLESVAENVPILGSEDRQKFWLKVERGESLEANPVSKMAWGALNKVFGPDSGPEGLAKYTWNHQGANCGENAIVLKTLLDRADVPARIIHTYDPSSKTESGNYAIGHDFVLVNLPAGADRIDPSKPGKVFAADAHGAFLGQGGITSNLERMIGTNKYNIE